MKAKINQRIFKVIKEVEINSEIKLKENMNVEIVGDVVYVEGYPIPILYQKLFYDFILENSNNKIYLKEDFRRFKKPTNSE
jgi:hypothetical protein